MTKVKALTIDNGGSELRVRPIIEESRMSRSNVNIPESGIFKDKNVKKAAVNSVVDFSQEDVDPDQIDEIIKCPGPFYKIDGSNLRVKDGVNKFHVINVKQAPKPEYIGCYGVGTTARMYTGEEIAMNSQTTKAESSAFYQRFIFGVALGLLSDKMFTGIEDGYVFEGDSKEAKENIAKFSEVFEIVAVTTIPIKLYAGNADAPSIIKGNLSGVYEVEFPLIPGKPVVQFKISPQFTGILAEGGVVMSSLKKELGDGYSILYDMGHITSELAVYKGNKLVPDYFNSSAKAGSMLLVKLESALADAGHPVNKETTLNALITGKLGDVADTDVKEIVERVKDDFVANQIKADLIDLFDGTGVLPTQITNIVAIGAPMDQDSVTGSIPQKMNNIKGLEKAKCIKLTTGIRYANINAAYPFAGILAKNVVKALG